MSHQADHVVSASNPDAGQPTRVSRVKLAISALFVAFPPIIFYSLLTARGLNIPYLDDYDGVLGFLNRMVQLDPFGAKVSYLIARQDSEFKLVLMHGVAWIQLALGGHVDFRLLGAIGNGSILLLAIVLWKLFLPGQKDTAQRLAWFIPVPWLLFQLQYWDALNWATPGLQHLPVLPFALGAVYFLLRPKRASFSLGLACLALAASSDGNGLIMIPIGMLILGLRRRYTRLAGWVAVSAGCIAMYAYHYHAILSEASGHGTAIMLSSTAAHRSLFSVILRMRPLYVVSFMGNAAGFAFLFKTSSIILGILLCLFFASLVFRGYYRRNPAVFYSLLFLLATSIGVAGLRSDFGLEQSLLPRYTIYSVLFVILAWFAIVEEFVQPRRRPLLNDGIFLSAVAAAILFSLFMDFAGAHAIDVRNQVLVEAMLRFEHPTPQDPAPSPSIPVKGPWPLATSSPFNPHAREVLLESMKLGIYSPPDLQRVEPH